MNKLLIILSFFAGFTSCTGKYKINGESSLPRLDGKKIFLKVSVNTNKMIAIDSAEVIHGAFTMKGKIDSARMVMLYMDEMSIMPLVLEKGHIKINIDKTNIAAKGTPLNDKLYKFFDQKTDLDERAEQLERREARLIMEGGNHDSISKEIIRENETLHHEMDELIKGFIRTNYENVLGPGVFMMFNSPYPVMPPLMETIYKESPSSFKNHHIIKEYVEMVRENEKRMKKGNR